MLIHGQFYKLLPEYCAYIYCVNLDCCFLVWKCSKISCYALFLSCARRWLYKRILFTQLRTDTTKNPPFKSWSASMFHAKIARRSKHNIKIYQRIPNLSWRHVNINWTVKCRCCLITLFFIIEECLSRSLVCDFVAFQVWFLLHRGKKTFSVWDKVIPNSF